MAASTLSIHSRQRAAGGKSASSTSRTSLALLAAAARRAVIGRTAGTWAARKIRARRRARPAGRTGGARRGRSSARGGRLRPGETQSSAEQQVDDFRPPVSTAVWARRRSGCRSGGRDRRRGRGRRRRRARSRRRRRSARLGRRASTVAPPPDRRRGVQDFRGDQRHGPRPAQPEGEDDVEHPKRQNFGFGRRGVRDGGRTPGRRPLRPPKPDRPPLRKPSGWMRGHSGPAARSSRAAASNIRPGSRLGGRPAPSRQSDNRFAAGPSGSPTAKRRSRSAASSALRRRILAAGRGALQRQAGAQRPGGGRVGAQDGVEQREPGAGGEQRIALPCPSARPRPGRDRRRRRKGLVLRGFRRARLGSRPRRGRRRNAVQKVWRAVGEQVEIGANHVGMVNRRRRFVTLCGEESAPLVVGRRCPISLHYRTSIRRPAQTPCQTPRNPALRPSHGPLKDAPEAALGARRGVGNTRAALERRPPCPQRPAWRKAFNRPHPKPLGPRARSGALPLTPGTAPRRRIATGRSRTRRGPPPLPRPIRRRGCSGDLGDAGPHRLVQPCSAGLGGAQRRQRPGSRGGTQSPRQAPQPGRAGRRRRRPRPGRRRRAIRPGAQSSRRRPGRRVWPKAGRRGA